MGLGRFGRLAFRHKVRSSDISPALATTDLPTLSYSDGGLLLLPRGYLGGGVTTRASSTSCSIAAFQARDSTNAANIISTTAIAKTHNSAWVAGTGNGGLGNGLTAGAPDTWLHVFVIKHTNGTVDAGFDTSTSAANLLTSSSYTYYRRVGSILTSADAAPNATILTYTQVADEFMWNDPQATLGTDVAENVAANATVFVPLGYSVVVHINTWMQDAGAAANAHIYTPTAVSDEIPSETAAPSASLKSTTTGSGKRMSLRTNTSSQIRYNLDGPAAIDNFDITTLGWTDDLGRFD